MSAQLSIDFARLERDAAMQRVAEKADRVSPGWSDEAAAFLRQFAGRTEWFTSADVIGMAVEAGIPQPHDRRAWGPVFMAAARSGLIAQDGFSRHAWRHKSICTRWRSAIYNRGPKK